MAMTLNSCQQLLLKNLKTVLQEKRVGCCNLKLDKLLEEIKFVKDKLNKVEEK